MEIIGLSGYARAGKDEAAKVLVDAFGFKRVAFADKLREVLYELNPIVNFYYNEHSEQMDTTDVQWVVDNIGWDNYKETRYGDEIRRLLQRLGTEAGRQTLWDSIWVDAAFAGLDDDEMIVIPDCRFENEAEEIQKRGGKIWRIERKGVGPANEHISETGLDKWAFDCVIHNDKGLEHFQQKIVGAYTYSRL